MIKNNLIGLRIAFTMLLVVSFFSLIPANTVDAATARWYSTKDSRVLDDLSGGYAPGAGASNFNPVGYYNDTSNLGPVRFRSLYGYTYSFTGIGTITNAVVYFRTGTQNYVTFGGSPQIYVRRLTETWNEGTYVVLSESNAVTWTNQPAATSTNQATMGVTRSESTWDSVNITALLQDALASGSFYGLKLISTDETTNNRTTEFSTSDRGDAYRSYIDITYDPVGPTPTPTPVLSCTCYSGCGVCTPVTVNGSCSDNNLTQACLQCAPPTCTLAASPSTINPGQTSTLTATCVPGAGGGGLTYSWPDPTTGTTNNINSNITTYTPPASYTPPTIATAYVVACNTNGGACSTPSSTNITLTCSSPPAPTGLAPSGSILSGDNSISWNTVTGATSYILTVTNQSTGDIDTFTPTITSQDYTFEDGTTYLISVKAVNGCDAQSAAATVNATTQSTIRVYVYGDLNANGFWETDEENGLSNITVNVTGVGGGTYTTGTGGLLEIKNLPLTSSTITVVPPPDYVVTTSNPRTIITPPSQIVSFGIEPTPPECTDFTASPYQVHPISGQNTSTLTLSGCPAGITFTFSEDSTIVDSSGNVANSVTNNGTNTSTWSGPSSNFWDDIYANPSAEVCFTSGACSVYTLPIGTGNDSPGIHIIPYYSISGEVYIDNLKNGFYENPPDTYFTLIPPEISIFSGPSCSGSPLWTSTSPTGTFNSPLMFPQGQYAVCLMNTSAINTSGYYPQSPSGTPPMYVVQLGKTICQVSTTPNPCTPEGNINNLGFGLTNSRPWIQSIGGDFYQNGFYDPIPVLATTTVPYGGGGRFASVFGIGGITPGIIYTGNQPANFGPAGSSASSPNWIVGGLNHPEVYASTGGPLSTSFALIDSLVDLFNKRSEARALSTVCIISACDLTSVPNGIYYTYEDLTLTTSTISNNKDLIILVGQRSVGVNTKTENNTVITPRNLNINGKVLVRNGSTLLVTVSGDINVSSTVGQASASTYCTAPQGANAASSGCDIEGYYSADRNFNINGSAACPVADLRLNVGGSIVMSAKGTGGGLGLNRDLCADGATYPVLSITERPDFILNSPEFFKTQRRVWQEVAP